MSPSRTIRRFARYAAWAVCATASVAAAHAQEPVAAVSASTVSTGTPRSEAGTEIAGEGVRLHAGFVFDPVRRTLRVDYRLRNTGPAPLAVFDRGDRHAVASGRLPLGAIAEPTVQTLGDDLVLSHVALPLPHPAPVSPPTPLARRLAPGAESAAQFEFALPGLQTPRRLRWCLGVAGFDEQRFSAPQRVGEIELWRASFALAQSQQRLCTPWFDLATARFASERRAERNG